MKQTQLQNISLIDIANAIDLNHTIIELPDTSEEHSTGTCINNTETIVLTENTAGTYFSDFVAV